MKICSKLGNMWFALIEQTFPELVIFQLRDRHNIEGRGFKKEEDSLEFFNSQVKFPHRLKNAELRKYSMIDLKAKQTAIY